MNPAAKQMVDKFKTCTCCKENLLIECFNKCSANLDGLNRRCKKCIKIWRDNYRKQNIQHIRERTRNYNKKNWNKIYKQTKNRESYKTYQKEYYRKNRKTLKERSLKNQQINRAQSNARKKKYKMIKKLAAPPWLTKKHYKQIENFYKQAKSLEQKDGISRHVDHIIPLQGKVVSGLHVPWNLQILTATKNLEKSNKISLTKRLTCCIKERRKCPNTVTDIK